MEAALYAERRAAGSVSNGEAVAFETVVHLTGDTIGYNPLSGEISIQGPGENTFYWWVAPQNATSADGTRFALTSPEHGDFFAGAESKNGQISGSAVIQLFSGASATFAVRYLGDGEAFFAQRLPVKGAVLVFGPFVDAFGAKLNLGGSMTLSPLPAQVPLPATTGVFSHVDNTIENTIRILLAGAYRVEATVAGYTTEGADVTVEVRINGVPYAPLTQSLRCVANTAVTFSFFNYTFLNAGTELTLWMYASQPVTFSTLPNSAFLLGVRREEF